jgi:hypothetical protein
MGFQPGAVYATSNPHSLPVLVRRHLPADPDRSGLARPVFDNYVAIRLRLKAYVLDTKYEKAFESDVTLRVLEAFAQKGIRPPAILHRHVADIYKAHGLDPLFDFSAD